MNPELKRAYPALKREWAHYGCVRRLTGVKGLPDFMLSVNSMPHIALFCEVKAVARIEDKTSLDLSQARTLQDLSDLGLYARVLVRVANKFWVCYKPPFLDERMKMIDLRWVAHPQKQAIASLLPDNLI